MKGTQENLPSLLAELLQAMPVQPLGPGKPERTMQSKLAAVDEQAFGRVVHREMMDACRAGLWLAFNFLDESHAISQELNTSEGSYWHGILHRREPDPSNAAYWFRHLGQHPLFALLPKEAESLGFRLGSDRWDPFAFIDLCEAHRGTGTTQETLLCQVQRREWELLFDWCFQRATGKE